MNARDLVWWCAVAWLTPVRGEEPVRAAAEAVSVTAVPETPYLEAGRVGQQLDVDFLLENPGSTEAVIQELEATVHAKDGAVIFRHHVGANGGSVDVIPDRTIPAGGALLVHNPLHTYDAQLRIDRVRFAFKVSRGEATERVQLEVRPRRYVQRAALRLPVPGRVLIHDGHDFLGHHRRFPLLSQPAKLLELSFNPTRTAVDFVVVDRDGAMFRGDGERNEDWYSWGAKVLSPGAGTVVVAVDGMEDGTPQRRPSLPPDFVIADPTRLMGNHVVIDHGQGEFSQLAHLRNGSVRVKVGQRVRSRRARRRDRVLGRRDVPAPALPAAGERRPRRGPAHGLARLPEAPGGRDAGADPRGRRRQRRRRRALTGTTPQRPFGRESAHRRASATAGRCSADAATIRTPAVRLQTVLAGG